MANPPRLDENLLLEHDLARQLRRPIGPRLSFVAAAASAGCAGWAEPYGREAMR